MSLVPASPNSFWPPAVETIIADRIAQFYDPARVRAALEDAAQIEHLQRWLQSAAAAPAHSRAAARGPDRTDLETFIDLLALCPVARSLIVHPKGFRHFLKLARRPRPLGAEGLEKTWRTWQAARDLPGDTDLARLQWFRLLMQARIFLADSRRRWSLTQATGEISDLAAVVVSAALEIAGLGAQGQIYLQPPEPPTAHVSAAATAAATASLARGRKSSRKSGSKPGSNPASGPVVAGTISVIGFGKLGGRELNYSSDIDLMFLFSPVTGVNGSGIEPALAQPATGSAPKGRKTSATRVPRKMPAPVAPVNQFDYDTVSLAAQRACQEVTRLLSESSGDGPLYRVDLRLRPHGSTGMIAQDAEYVKRYYYSVGRVWERQALLKARPLCGDKRLGRRLFEQLYTFLYPPFTGQDLLAQIAALKAHIEARAETDSGDQGINVKTGTGGIRDIEFTVQLLQLLHAGDMPDLRVQGTLEALDALEKRRLLTPAESGDLRNAYVFLRHVEHRLQAPHNRQTHKLELTEATVREVAFLMGYGDDPRAPRGPLGRFQAELSRHRREVRRIFESIFQTITAAQPDTLTALLESGEAVAAITAELARRQPALPADDRNEQARILTRLTQDASSLIASRRSRDLFARVAPKLLVQFARYPDATAALRRFEGIVASLGAGRELYHLLLDQPLALELFCRLTALAPPITEILTANPGAIDEIFDALQTGATQAISAATAQHIEQAAGPRIASTLAGFQDIHFLRVASGLLMDKPDIVQSAATLTELAEAIVKAQVRHALRSCLELPGVIREPSGGGTSASTAAAARKPATEAPFAVFALGKFGGRGLSFGSDLDMLFFHDLDDRAWSSAVGLKNYTTATAQAILGGLENPVRGRKIYEVDLKLRPDGRQGELVSTRTNLEQYLARHAAIWEQLSLTQVRAVCGPPGLIAGILSTIDAAIYRPRPDAAAICAEARDMRDRQAAEAVKTRSLNIKRLRGGICDLDFYLSALQLIHGHRLPVLRHAATDDMFRLVVEHGLLPAHEGTWARATYWQLRALEFLVRLTCGWHASTLPESGIERQRLETAWTLHWELADLPAPAVTPLEFWKTTAPKVKDFFDRRMKN